MTNTIVDDPDVPAVRALLGAEAVPILSAALGRADIAAARPWQVRYRPGRSITVAHQVYLPSAEAPTIVVTHSGRHTPEHATIVSDGADRVAVWQYPFDPELPGLPIATDPVRLSDLLHQVGVDEAVEQLDTRSYRPTRRAVIEARTASHRVFVKVVPPRKVTRLQTIHRLVAEQLTVPRSLGWSEETGLVLLEALEGLTLRRSLERSSGPAVPEPGALAGALDRLPAVDVPAPPTLAERVPAHVELLTRLLPSLTEPLRELSAATATIEGEASVPVHGDFHSSQVLVAGGSLVGLVDIDSVHVGQRADDLATMIGHLYVVGLESRGRETVREYGRRALRVFDELVANPRSFRLRIAAALLGFATGPFRAQQPDWPAATTVRVQAAREWAATMPGGR